MLNNGANESVGGQKSAGHTINLTEIAKACNYHTPSSFVTTKEDLQTIIQNFKNKSTLSFVDVYVRQGIRKDMPKLGINHIEMKDNLSKTLQKQK